jgi:toxin ParE1/3/4
VKYLLHSKAAVDLQNLAEYYQQQAGATLVRTFIAEFERSMAMLLTFPLLGAKYNGKRRLVMRRFPCTIIYIFVEQEIRVLAVAHQRRNPDYWLKRSW